MGISLTLLISQLPITHIPSLKLESTTEFLRDTELGDKICADGSWPGCVGLPCGFGGIWFSSLLLASVGHRKLCKSSERKN